jgi:hypothetical protein
MNNRDCVTNYLGEIFMKSKVLPGSKELLLEVRGRFIQRGETLSGWCAANGIKLPNARSYLRGDRDGVIAREWRERIVAAARGENEEV